jgi:outer membrane protein assembly factor BamB
MALATGCSSSTASTGTSTGASSSGSSSGGGSSGAACANVVGSCYGNVSCPVGSVCEQDTHVCCQFSNASTTGGSSSSGGGSSIAAPDAGPPYALGWPKWHYDNTDRGLSPADTSGNTGALLWKFNVGVPDAGSGAAALTNPNPTYMNSPVVDGKGTVYQLGMDGTFYAVGDGGVPLWTAALLPPNPDEHPSTPIIAADNSLYIEAGADGASASTAAQLYHLDSATGKILYQAGPPTVQAGAPMPDGFDVCPSIGGDGLLFDGDDFFTYVTYRLEPDGSFTQLNYVDLELYGERVAVALDQNDNSYWCASNLCLAVTPPEQGFQVERTWPPLGAQIGHAPLPTQGATTWANSDLAYDEAHTGWLMVEVGVQDGGTGSTEVVAMDPGNGSAHWDTQLPSGPTPGAYDPATQAGIFSSDVGNSAPAIGPDGTVYVGNVDGLYALNGANGSTVWSYQPSQDTGAGADVDTAAAIGADGTIFFGTAGGTFYAVKGDGTERFHFKTAGRISSSPAIGPDGTAFFVSDDGYLYAIR